MPQTSEEKTMQRDLVDGMLESNNGTEMLLDDINSNVTDNSSWDTDFRDSTRFWVQHVLVPVVVVVGVLGNISTILILTRRQMRTSSNVYLTALAVSDLMFLIFSLSLSWKHYDCMKRLQFYWDYIPIGLWITDASSSTSVWLTVSFTIERYIAVGFPIIGKVYCTEKRAKYVCLLVYIFCFLLTASTPFEWKSVAETVQNPAANNQTVYLLQNTDLGKNPMYRLCYHWFTTIFFVILPLLILVVINTFLINAVRKSRIIRESMTRSQLNNQHCVQSMRQEDRITIILISVVIVFLFCQMPTAVVLIYTSLSPPAIQGSLEENVLLGLGNIFNLLVSVNAACNFVLYTALSDKYRKVFLNILSLKFWGKGRKPKKGRRLIHDIQHDFLRANEDNSGINCKENEPPMLMENALVSIHSQPSSSRGKAMKQLGSSTLAKAAESSKMSESN